MFALRSNGLKWCGITRGWRVHCRLSLQKSLSCHPRYRSVYCNVKYHCTLEDIFRQFCQASLEYFFLIAPAVAGRKWLPRGFFFF